MSRIAFVFPGQGAQYVGMGVDLATAFPAARTVLEEADRRLGYPLSRLMAEGPEEQLKQTEHTQPAIVAHSLAALAVLRERGLSPAMVAGHSVGEYAALAACGAVSPADAIVLVRKRGLHMQAAGQQLPGTMAALLGIELAQAEALCQAVSAVGVVEVANLNCPGQIVLSGSPEGVAAARERASEFGARRFVPLAVSGAFHSSLMQPAAERLAVDLDGHSFANPTVPLVANFSAQSVTTGEELRHALKLQIVSRVLWEDSVRAMIAAGIDAIVEVGPGSALCGMIKKISGQMRIANVADVASLEKSLELLQTPVL
ncbi:[acyl-carrier-protein] S-malonyltransferase [bacterium CPR1]|nr:[acyl-carrier-protein] S-malonyltransferase [bacterium CPR1]